jgi:predicted Zn-dependent peptidase
VEFVQQTLANGLEIVAEVNPQACTTALGFFVKTGARDETDELSGVSHFLEHMVFKGTRRRSAEDVNRELDELGSHSNAYTSEEETVYYATVLPEFQDRMLDLLADILRPALRADDFAVEKKVILEEIAKYEDQPPYGAVEKCMAAHFGPHSLARSVLGTNASVGALTPEQMLEYFRRRYAPGNIVLIAAGNVDFPRLVRETQRHCGDWEPLATTRETPVAPRRSNRLQVHKPLAVQQYTVDITNFPAAADPDRYAGRLLATILGDESGSRLFWELVDTGRAEVASTSSYEFLGAGILTNFLACQPEDTAENLATLRAVIAELLDGGVAADELARAQSKHCSHLVLQSERPSNRLFSIGHQWIQRREYRNVRESVRAYRETTLDDLAALARKYPLLESTVVTVGPLTKSPWK